MSFVFICPHCEHQSRIDNRFHGQTGPCVNCGKSITVERPEMELPSSDEEQSSNATGLALLLLLAGLVFFGTVGGLIYVVVIPQVDYRRQVATHERTRQKLLSIGQALRAYEEVYGSLPPAIVYDTAGKPMHSWRVLILPQLGYADLYARYDFSQPWNSAANSYLAYEMPAEYASATDRGAVDNAESSFYVIMGKGCPFPDQGSIRRDEIQDDLADTVLVVETLSFGFSWMEPREMRLARLESRVNGAPGHSIASKSPLGPQVLTADGEVRTIRDDAPAEAITGLATINGGEPINWKAVAK